ncbi:MAG: FimB/Mfa2 family fimbrial subunit [Tannerellaceae bacterium]|nr:FimB/Mfa2 family fimbrial subunit [Tannerellaceae bacterium]
MKKITLFLIGLLALTGCLEEGAGGCPSYLRLTFLHDRSAEEFDRVIGNDIHLLLYNNDVLESVRVIPYEVIAGGKDYLIRKEYTGTIDIVAFASPVSEPVVEPLPEYGGLDKKSESTIQMRSASQAHEYQSMGSIYLGVESYEEKDITRETVCPVSLINCISKVSVSVYAGDEFLLSDSSAPPRIELSGCKSNMNLDFEPGGDDVTIPAGLEYNSEKGCFESGVQGMLPSAADQYLTVQGYRGDTPLFVVRTDLQARPGAVIHIEIYRKTVVIEVDGWRIYDAIVEWL